MTNKEVIILASENGYELSPVYQDFNQAEEGVEYSIIEYIELELIRKWLRDNSVIYIVPFNEGKFNHKAVIWYGYDDTKDKFSGITETGFFNTYEEVVAYCILYVIENFIKGIVSEEVKNEIYGIE